MKILITGFEPFGQDFCNPSGEVLKLLPKQTAGHTLIRAVLPVARGEAEAVIFELIEKEQPDCVISLGLAAGRKGISIERTAVNIDDFRIPDNAGAAPCDERISPDGPDAWFSSLPYRRMEAAVREAGWPVYISESAGTFVCNHVFYAVRERCEKHWPQIRSGFIHLPCSDEMGRENVFSMPLADMAEALKAALSAL